MKDLLKALPTNLFSNRFRKLTSW